MVNSVTFGELGPGHAASGSVRSAVFLGRSLGKRFIGLFFASCVFVKNVVLHANSYKDPSHYKVQEHGFL